MVIKNEGTILRHLNTLFNIGAIGTLTDGQLLERFADGHGEAKELAFAALVERHGPFVLRICRAVLGNEHEADDAFQATFFALVRKANSLWVQDSLRPWLHQAAFRAASHDRAARTRRRVHERAAAMRSEWRDSDNGSDELESVIHEEINRLPSRYRIAVVLCDLEGRTLAQAARHIGCAVGTVKSRLARGREKLRRRLFRRGVTPAHGTATTVAGGAATANVPPALVEATVRYAVYGKSAARAVPAAVASFAAWMQRSRHMIKVLLVTAAVVTLGAIGFSPSDSERRPVSGIRFDFVDLQPKGNHKLSDPLGLLDGNDLAKVPEGPRMLAGTWYMIGEKLIRVRGQESPTALRQVPGLAQLRSTQPVQGQPSSEPPEAVRAIPIGARFDTLHILHSTMFGNAFGADDGTEIGAYIVHYTNGTEERIPIIYGKDVRDWWRSSDPADPSRGKLAWAGKNAAAGEDDQIRIFSSEWKNPHPDKKVMSIDFETKNTVCAPFLIALTLERAI